MVRSTQRACQLLQSRGQHPHKELRHSRRCFHDYFITQLPSSSLHPDSQSSAGPRHQLPRSASKPHVPRSPGGPSPAPLAGAARDTTIVRIPLKSAKHHFGVSVSRGQRPYNEDAYQAGVIDIPAFAKRNPISLTTRAPPSSPLQAYREQQQKAKESPDRKDGENNLEGKEAASGDPQVFYFGVYDGHGGAECSDFLKDTLHSYIEEAAKDFELASTLKTPSPESSGKDKMARALELEDSLIKGWKGLVGGYFRRFKPALFSQGGANEAGSGAVDISTVLTYAFLRADYEFVRAQARKPDGRDADPILADAPLNASDVLHDPYRPIGGATRFQGGSTCSAVLVSTPTPTPFWHPGTASSLVVAHVGDSRVILCRTADGLAVPVTTDHHPSNPGEGRRLRRYAGNIVTDSFGEERLGGLANTRAFGDMRSKRVGVSAEPEIRRVELAPAQYAFMLLVSDGVSGTLSDQEAADVAKEAKTPEQAARDVVALATELGAADDGGDNATCLCVRLGGWERREEGGLGSLGTREGRQYRRQEAADPRKAGGRAG